MVNRRGFTLVEILVVVGILAISVPSVLMISAYTANLRNQSRLRTSATLLAEAKTERLLAYSDDLPSTPDAGLQAAYNSFQAEPGTVYQWQWAWQQTPSVFDVLIDPSDPSKGTESTSVTVSSVVITVKWTYRGREQLLRTATYARTDG